MKNYEKLFREQMQNPEFAKAYHEAKSEKKLDEMLDDLKEKIDKDAPKNLLLETINSIQHQI